MFSCCIGCWIYWTCCTKPQWPSIAATCHHIQGNTERVQNTTFITLIICEIISNQPKFSCPRTGVHLRRTGVKSSHASVGKKTRDHVYCNDIAHAASTKKKRCCPNKNNVILKKKVFYFRKQDSNKQNVLSTWLKDSHKQKKTYSRFHLGIHTETKH